MKKLSYTILSAFFLCFLFNSHAQQAQEEKLSLFIADSLPFKNINGDDILDPFSGGIESPRFYKMELNGDGKEDLVVFDRKNSKISTYINNGGIGNAKYKYSPEFEHFFPKGKHNYFIIDVDRDGFLDVIAGDVSRNDMNFYKNNGLALPNTSFQPRGSINYYHFQRPAEDFYNGLSSARQHVPTFDDIDGDGDLDYLNLGVLGGSIELYINRQVEENLPADSLHFFLSDLCYGFFVEELNNKVLLNECKQQKYHIRRHAAGSSILSIDFNKDGDKDLVMGNNGYNNLVQLTNGYADFAANYDSMIAWDSVYPINTAPALMNTFLNCSYQDITGDGIKDLVVVPTFNTDNSIDGINQTLLYTNSGQNDSPIFNYAGNNFLMNSSIDLGENCSPAFYDYDGDGDQDLFIAYSGNYSQTKYIKDRVALYKNIGTPKKPSFQLMDMNFGEFDQFGMFYSRLAIYDLDKDGRYEFYFGQGDGHIEAYKFNGTIENPDFFLHNDKFGNVQSPLGYASPSFWDFDQDGATDMIVGSNLGEIAWHRNHGTNNVPDFKLEEPILGNMITNIMNFNINPPRLSFFGASAPLATDLNGDGKMDVISGSISGKMFAWKSKTNAKDSFEQFEDFIKYLDINKDTLTDFNFGKNTAVAATDLDGDTIQDIIVTNDAGGIYYLSGKAKSFIVSTPFLKTFGAKLYPNPTQGNIHIVGLPNFISKEVQVLNTTGQVVRSINVNTQEINLDLDGLDTGLYLIRINAQGYHNAVYKVIKK